MNHYSKLMQRSPAKGPAVATRTITVGTSATATTAATSTANSTSGGTSYDMSNINSDFSGDANGDTNGFNCYQTASANTSAKNSPIAVKTDADGLLHDLVMPVNPDDPANLKMSAEEKAERERKQRRQGAMAIGDPVQNRVAAYLTATASSGCNGYAAYDGHASASSSSAGSPLHASRFAVISSGSSSFDNDDPEETIAALAAFQHKGSNGNLSPTFATPASLFPAAASSGLASAPASASKPSRASAPGHRKCKSTSEVGAFYMPGAFDGAARTKGMESSTTDDGGDACAVPPPVPSRVHSAKTALAASSGDSISTSTPNPIQLQRNRDFAMAVRPGAVHMPGRPNPHPSVRRSETHGHRTPTSTPGQVQTQQPRHRRSRSASSHGMPEAFDGDASGLSFGMPASGANNNNNNNNSYCETSEDSDDCDDDNNGDDGNNNEEDVDDDGSFSYAEEMDDDHDDDNNNNNIGINSSNHNSNHSRNNPARGHRRAASLDGATSGVFGSDNTSAIFADHLSQGFTSSHSRSRNDVGSDHFSASSHPLMTAAATAAAPSLTEHLVVAAELSPPDLNANTSAAILTESEVEARVRRKIFLEAAQAQVVSVDPQHLTENSSTNSSQNKRPGTPHAVAIQELSQEAKRIAEFKALHRHRTIREKVFGNARSQQAIDISATPECIRKRTTLKWTVRRNPATNLWVTAIHTNQKALEKYDVAELERSVVNYSAVTQKEALEIGQAMAKPKMLRYADNPICFVCRDKFALLRRPSHCRNCGVCICNACIVHWPSKMVPETFHKKRSTESGPAPGTRSVKVCLACDWLATCFREALQEGNYDTAVDLYATGNINLRQPLANVKKSEVLYPIHAAILGGNLRLVQWLTNAHCVPLRHADKGGNQPNLRLKRNKEGPVRTSRGKSALQLAMEHNKMEIICHLVAERQMTFSDEREFKDVGTLVTFAESLVKMLPNNFFEKERPNRIEGTTLPASPEGASAEDLVAPIHAMPNMSPPSPILSQGTAFPSDVSSLGPSASQAGRRGSF